LIKHCIRRQFILFAGIISLSGISFGQNIEGRVLDIDKQPLVGANVYWINTTNGTVTNDSGQFKLSGANIQDKRLVASYVGYLTDTINFINQEDLSISLSREVSLDEIVVKENRPDRFVSSVNPIKTEVITSGELSKGACCDLAGCFNTTATVQPATSNVITNSQELRILGLSGIYNQLLFDDMPIIQGLSYTYGISSIPGPLVENIFVAKGANSVIQGFEIISGQINVIPKEPENSENLLLNAYANSFSESQLNAVYSNTVGKRKEWKNLTAIHMVQPASRVDRDKDNFLDLPLLTRYMFYNKLKYRDDISWGWSSEVGIMFLNEQRVGGQVGFNAASDKGSSEIYGQTVNINQPTIYTKTSYRFHDDQALSFLASGYFHSQNAWFGETYYNADQVSFAATLRLEQHWGVNHDLKTGLSIRQMRLDEDISFTANPLNKTYGGDYLHDEVVAGIFAENIFRWFNDKLTWIGGIRADHHNTFGWYFTPRSLVKYDFTANTTVRATTGYGWRTAYVFPENINLLASQRDVLFQETLKPEEALNFGINCLQRFTFKNISGYISADYYQTRFINQIFPDYNTDPTKAFLTNFTGTSVSNGFQVDLDLTFHERLSFKASYNFLEVFRETESGKILLPFVPRDKVLSSVSYQPLNKKWQVDLNAHWYGVQQLPETSNLPGHLRRPQQSKSHIVMNAQLSRNWKNFEVYIGLENMFDFRQKQPIISWQDPFSPYFDTSSIWGPTRGREGYIGVRYRFNRSKE
jgi:outer membrane receptor for ferrienterochelin and colicin